MAQCNTCGNAYDKSFEVIAQGQRYVFDCFECAIHEFAPACQHCGCRVIGQAVEEHRSMYCCAGCVRHTGVDAVRDRV